MIRQLFNQLRQAILSGRLQPEARLLSSRELADQLRISRNVVLEAFDMLHAEGYVYSRPGAGTYVATGAIFTPGIDIPKPPQVENVTMGYDSPEGVINFRAGTPHLKLFPKSLWQKMINEVFSAPLEETLAYGHPEGRAELRQAICDYVVTQREVVCHPDQIVITAGTTQAIGIACNLLLKEKKDVFLEDPITKDIQLIVQNHGGVLHPVAVDSDGMNTSELPETPIPAFIYVTPSHQFPIGGTLPIQRRIDLLKFSRKTGCYIIEDDYDSEFRFDGPPLSSLHGLLPERVIYIGTFSKTLCPAIRIGYMVLPPELINRGRSCKWLRDLHNEVISQLALARFISQGHYLRHVRKMRKHYVKRRRDVVVKLEQYFGDRVEILGSAAGLHLVARFRDCQFTDLFFNQLETAGARFYPVGQHAIGPEQHRDKIMIGYGNLSSEEISNGIEILAKHFDRNLSKSMKRGHKKY
jgi:GntR family transcriptional regulator/MocR family aminotransferase